MGKKMIYYGIQFPEGFELNEEQQRKLAKLLFISPTTSAKEARKIINNSKLISVINLLFENLSCEIENIRSNKNVILDENKVDGDDIIEENEDSNDIFDIETIIQSKLVEWVKVFGIPTEEEIVEAGKELKVQRADAWIKTIQRANFIQLNTPFKIAEFISLYVIGQQEAVKTMSIIINEQKMRSNCCDKLPKTSALFIGGTGTGKSLLVNKGKEILDAPMVRISSGELVPSGVVGNTINKYLTTLHQSTGGDADKTSSGILYFDEIDKISKYYHSGDDDWKTTIQLEILKLFDSDEKIYFPSSHEQWARPIEILTNNFLLLFSGAFSGIDAIILARLLQDFGGNSKLIDKDNLFQYCTIQDVQDYGIMPELAGRLSYICTLRSLKIDDIFNIMTTAKDSDLSKHIKKCELLGFTLQFTDGALRLIADKVVKQNLGARYVNTLFNTLLKGIYYNPPTLRKKEIIIDRNHVARVLNASRYQLVYDAFEKNIDVMKVANDFQLSPDKAFDIYLEWKSIKMEDKDYVI